MSQDYMPPLFSPNGNKWNLISLLFSLFYFLPIFFMIQELQVWQWVCIFIAYVVFLILYFWGLKSDSNSALFPILTILSLCYATTYVTPGSNALFGFATFLIGYYFPLKRAFMMLVLALLVEVVAFTWLQHHDLVLFGIAIFLSVVLFINAIFLRMDLQHRFAAERDQLHIQQLSAIAERERISRDLHDLLGHSLSSIALKAELAEKLINSDRYQSAATEIAVVAELARSTLADVRETVAGLKQTGLYAELNKLCQCLQSAGFDTQCENELPDHYSLSADIESSIILLLKEASTNILRHSNGNRARLQIEKNQDALLVSVWDNGQATKLEAGNGVKGMQDRCRSLGGQLTLQHNDKGTLLKMTVRIST